MIRNVDYPIIQSSIHTASEILGIAIGTCSLYFVEIPYKIANSP